LRALKWATPYKTAGNLHGRGERKRGWEVGVFHTGINLTGASLNHWPENITSGSV